MDQKMPTLPTTVLKLPFHVHFDQHTVDAVNRYRAARAEHLRQGHGESMSSAELFVAYQWAAFDLATALDALLETHAR
ncbi:hypothetical protein CVV67_19030 [Arthrobacter stackebrandtii]|nr:hypothetical protein CVV67_19030 [Arthrobacter stackebrandtii]